MLRPMKQVSSHKSSPDGDSLRSQLTNKISLCILSAFFLAISFSFSSLGFLAWFGFVPLFLALENAPKGKRFLLAYLAGVLYWAGTIYWLVHVTLPGTIILVLYLALYFAFLGLAFPYLLSTDYYLLSIPSAWVLLEYVRSYLFTGFPWALLGYSQYRILPIIQIADIFGAWGVSFLVMLVNCLVYALLKKKKPGFLPVALLSLALVYGLFKVSFQNDRSDKSLVKVSVIQGNIPQELKWEPSQVYPIVEQYVRLTEEASLGSPDLIVWPEAASPALFGRDEDVFGIYYALAKKIKVPLLLGTVARFKDEYFNSVLLIGPDGKPGQRYDKLHLVPFGEYIPLKKYLPFLETVVPIGDITAGKEYTIFQIRNPNIETNPKPEYRNKFAVLICFEDLFPELSLEFVRHGAQFLVVITNDAWYKRTTAPYQHLQASVLRAVENRVYIARAANTGASVFISPSGRVTSRVRDKEGRDIFVEGFATQVIQAGRIQPTLYSHLPLLTSAFCILILFYGIIRTPRKKTPR
jgi:apolipoprotein N-acyltransferase